MGRTTIVSTRISFIVDERSVMRDGGHQIDWANVADTYKNADGKKEILAGTVMGTLLGSGKMSPRVATTNPAVGVLATTAVEGSPNMPKSGYGLIIGAAVYENLLPDASGSPAVLATAVKNELKANGYAWSFHSYADSRAV